MKLWSAAVMLVLTLGAAQERTCDCDHWPWPPSCKDKCYARILTAASKEQLKDTLKLPEKTADKIVDQREEKELTSVDDLKGTLTDAEVTTVKTKLGNLKVTDVQKVMPTVRGGPKE